MNKMNAIVTLTNSPRVVELKREFRELDARTEELKFRASLGCSAQVLAELERVQAKKSVIAREIFQWGET